MILRSQIFRHLLFITLAIVLFPACGEQEPEDSSGTRKSSIEKKLSNDNYLDNKGRLWEKTRDVEYIKYDGVPPPPTENENVSEPSPISMSLDKIAEMYRPVTEFNGIEYRLSNDDTLELAKEIHEAIIQFEGKELIGLPLKEEKEKIDLAPLKQPMIIGNTDSRSNINAYADDSPQSTIAGRDTSGPYCTAFKMLNAVTAITAAHCVYDRDSGSWYTRQDWWFGAGAKHNSGGASRSPLPASCYSRTIPAGWISSGGIENDYAIIRFREKNGGPWCPWNDFSTGALGYIMSQDAMDFDVRVQGYPAPYQNNSPAGSWTYPTLWHHRLSSGGWIPRLVYPKRVFHHADTSGGQSGAPIQDAGINRVRGIHSGSTWIFPTGYRNQGRRLSADVITWFMQNAGS